jgi:carboxymethylenebutenolidase
VLAGACPIVGSYGGKDRSPMGYRAAARLERALVANQVAHDIKCIPRPAMGSSMTIRLLTERPC